MPGRYAIVNLDDELFEMFNINERPAFLKTWKPQYNLAPMQTAPVIRRADGASNGNRLDLLQWGLIPHWAKDHASIKKQINARSESVAEKRTFSDAFRHRRCIVPATGYFEWKETHRGKQPFFIFRADGEPIAFAGIWESWQDQGRNKDLGSIESFAVITCEPNEQIAEIHHRMGVILPRELHDAWLDPDNDPESLHRMMQPLPNGVLDMYPVSRSVSKTSNKSRRCIEPLEDDEDIPPSLFR